MTPLLIITVAPVITGIFGYLISKLRNEFNFLGAAINLYYAFLLFINVRRLNILSKDIIAINNFKFGFTLDRFGSIIIIAIAITCFIVLVYSFRSARSLKNLNSYYLYLSLTAGIANAMVLANNLLFFGILSIFLTLILCALLIATAESPRAFIYQILLSVILYNIFFLAGAILLFHNTLNLTVISDPRIILSTPTINIAFLLLLVGLLGKIGLIPFHQWTNQIAQKSPASVFILIPSVIEKITGAYMLIRITQYIFNLNQSHSIRLLIIGIGVINIIIAGILALRSKGIYQFLNQNAMVQLGFILLGLGWVNPLALAGSIFHLLNYLTFQPTLLFTAGSFEYWTKTTLLENFGGLGGKMPITFFMLLLAILVSVGIPPLSGFFSKWLILQGVLTSNTSLLSSASILSIVGFFFGIIVTPIYFLKYIRSFRGTDTHYSLKIRDPGFTMWTSSAILILIAFVLGIFVRSFSWQTILVPVLNSIKTFSHNIPTNPFSLSYLPFAIISSIILGIILYYLKFFRHKIRSVA
ncbi:MAG: hypothetical protein KGZ86_05725 [Candidatus Latescibacteria bacterium]|nr:hypothetical protein [Candidatus Latescibacterota bacterium]